ncbi:MAG TPA: MCP four helix bundle domain-containing protein, partial [Sulfuricurvum sp.]|nr:MCP four helix bundle domain-containing protein [Sulfuricurvum sp.]
MLNQRLNTMSIQKRMNYLVGAATMSVIGAAIFVFFALSSLENQYDDLQKNTIKGAVYALEIEKELNYISRTSRDIMLGGDYTKNMAKLHEHINKINESFAGLKESSIHEEEKVLLTEAEESTNAFLDNTLKMMTSLDPASITTNTASIYARYKKEMTPYADASRESFEKVVKDKHHDLSTSAEEMHNEIAFYKFFVLFTGVGVAVLIFIFASMVRRS